MDKQAFLNLIVNVLIPTLWGSSGAAITSVITAWSNAVIKRYVPREVQIPLAGILGAIAGSIIGPEMSVDWGLGAGIGGASSTLIRSALSVDPRTFLASAKESPEKEGKKS